MSAITRTRAVLCSALARALLLSSTGCSRSGLDDDFAFGDVGAGGADAALDGTIPADGEPMDVSVPDGPGYGDSARQPEAGIGPLCGPTNCKACCQPDGTCSNTDQLCGFGGVACVVCPTGFHCYKNPYCVMDDPGCGPSNCDGCCWNGNICVSGTNGGLCGHQGQVCQPCAAGLHCVPDPGGIGGSCHSTPPECSPATCNGCCYGPICAEGMQDIACGTGGVACVDCASSSETCQGGACGK